MKITIECDGMPDQIRADIGRLFGFTGKPDGKEAEAALQTVKKILQEPVAPEQHKKTETKQTESENIKPEREKKSHKREIKSPKRETKKEWTPKQKDDINAIREAYEKQKKEKEKLKGGGKHNIRNDIDNSLIVYMRDEQGKTIKEIAKSIGCCQQTVLNRYNREKREQAKADKS